MKATNAPRSHAFWIFSATLLGCSSPNEETSSSSHFATCNVDADCTHISALAVCVDAVCVDAPETPSSSHGDVPPQSTPVGENDPTMNAAIADPAAKTPGIDPVTAPIDPGAPLTEPPASEDSSEGNAAGNPSEPSSCPSYAAVTQQMRFGTDALAGVTLNGRRYIVQRTGATTRVFTSEAGALIPATVLGISETTLLSASALAVDFEDSIGVGQLKAPLEAPTGPFTQWGLRLEGPQGTYAQFEGGERLQWIHPLAVADGVLGAGRAPDGTVFVLDAAEGELRLFYSDSGTLLRTRFVTMFWMTPDATAEAGALQIGFGGPPGYAFLLIELNNGDVSLRLQETGHPFLESATPDPSAPSGWVTSVLLPGSFGNAIQLGEDLALEDVGMAALSELTMCPQEPWAGE